MLCATTRLVWRPTGSIGKPEPECRNNVNFVTATDDGSGADGEKWNSKSCKASIRSPSPAYQPYLDLSPSTCRCTLGNNTAMPQCSVLGDFSVVSHVTDSAHRSSVSVLFQVIRGRLHLLLLSTLVPVLVVFCRLPLSFELHSNTQFFRLDVLLAPQPTTSKRWR